MAENEPATVRTFIADPSPWRPMDDPIDLMVAGKLAEELAECGAAISRCIIQGIEEAEPNTGEINRKWLEKEVADVLANIECACERFALDQDFIEARKIFKIEYLRKWHSLNGSAYQPKAGNPQS